MAVQQRASHPPLLHTNPQHLQLTVQVTAFHADLLGGFGDVALVFPQFGLEIIAFKVAGAPL